jgi:AhpD family alkylhydroperoxidase
MEKRINIHDKGRNALKALYGLGSYMGKSTIEQQLSNLICFRVSQINGCAYCLDMHSKDLRAEGETEQRLHMLAAWRESPFYTARERAALAWAEAVTELDKGRVCDEVYDEVTRHFSEEEIIDLTIATITINCYNRINVAFRVEGGSYVVGQHKIQQQVQAAV